MEKYQFSTKKEALAYISNSGYVQHSKGDWNRTYYKRPSDVDGNNIPLPGTPNLQFWKHPVTKKYEVTIFCANS